MRHRFDPPFPRPVAWVGLCFMSISALGPVGCGADRFAARPVIEPNHTAVVELAPSAPRFAGRSYLGHPAFGPSGPRGSGDPPAVSPPMDVFATVNPVP